MNKFMHISGIVIVSAVLASCTGAFPDKNDCTSVEIFDEIWNSVNEKYVCFPNKDIDWYAAYDKYREYVTEETEESQLFGIICHMLGELKDGHISLTDGYRTWYGCVPDSAGNISHFVVSLYLGGTDCKIAGGLRYNTIHNGKIGLIKYDSFNDDISYDDLDVAFEFCKDCFGIIFDLRDNSGGMSTNMMKIIDYLPCNDALYKTSVRHNDNHADFIPLGIMHKSGSADKNRIWNKPFVVLVDNNSYSASSIFAHSVKDCENVCVMGVKTAGGTNLPYRYELSNGWIYRLPTIKILSIDGDDYECGVPPDIEVVWDKQQAELNKDNIIDAACEYIIDSL